MSSLTSALASLSNGYACSYLIYIQYTQPGFAAIHGEKRGESWPDLRKGSQLFIIPMLAIAGGLVRVQSGRRSIVAFANPYFYPHCTALASTTWSSLRLYFHSRTVSVSWKRSRKHIRYVFVRLWESITEDVPLCTNN